MMFRCVMPGSGNPIVSEYVPLSDINEPRLNMLASGGGIGRTVHVSSSTFDLMSLAHKVMQKTGYETFPDGPGNREAAIWMSGGRSWARTKLYFNQTGPTDSEARIVKNIKATGGGNCSEYSRMVMLEYQRHKRHQPVFEVTEAMAHKYVIVGDWRDRTVGDQAIVVDPWQGLKKVHTYGEKLSSRSPIVNKTVLPGSPVRFSSELKAALSAKANTSSEFQASIVNLIHPHNPGPYAAQQAILRDKILMFDSVTSSQNLHTTYVDPQGRSSAFNSAPPAYVSKYMDARESMQS